METEACPQSTEQKRERGRNGQPTWPFLPSFPGHQRSVQVRENSGSPNPTFPPGHSSDLVATGLPQPACNSGLRMSFSRSRSSEARSLIQTVSCGKAVKGVFEALKVCRTVRTQPCNVPRDLSLSIDLTSDGTPCATGVPTVPRTIEGREWALLALFEQLLQLFAQKNTKCHCSAFECELS